MGETEDLQLTTTEAGQLLGYGKDTVIDLCEKGTFPGAHRGGKPSGQWRIPKSDVLAHRERIRAKVQRRKSA